MVHTPEEMTIDNAARLITESGRGEKIANGVNIEQNITRKLTALEEGECQGVMAGVKG